LGLSESAYRIYSKPVQVRKCFHQRHLPNITDCMLHVDGGRTSMSSQPTRCNLSSAVLVSMEIATIGLTTESVMSTINQLSESHPPQHTLSTTPQIDRHIPLTNGPNLTTCHPPSLTFSTQVNERVVERSKDKNQSHFVDATTIHHPPPTLCVFSFPLL
jgi:hypothetical protein